MAAATLTELEPALVGTGADEAFLLSQLRIGASLPDAERAWMTVLHARNQDLTSRVQAAERGKMKAPFPALPDLPGGAKAASGESATDQWHAAIKAKTDKGLPKAAAIQAVVRENGELHEAYLAEVNAGRE